MHIYRIFQFQVNGIAEIENEFDSIKKHYYSIFLWDAQQLRFCPLWVNTASAVWASYRQY